MTVLRVCYKSGIHFDEQYYLSTHLPLTAVVMGPHGVTNVEMVRITGTADGSAAPYQVIFSAYFDSESSFERAMQDPRMPEILADIRKFYDGMPDVLVGEVVSLPALSR